MKKPYFSKKDFKIIPFVRKEREKDFGAVQGRNGYEVENAQENIYPDNYGRKVKKSRSVARSEYCRAIDGGQAYFRLGGLVKRKKQCNQTENSGY